MRFAASSKARSGFVAAGVAVAGALSGSAEASVIRAVCIWLYAYPAFFT